MFFIAFWYCSTPSTFSTSFLLRLNFVYSHVPIRCTSNAWLNHSFPRTPPKLRQLYCTMSQQQNNLHHRTVAVLMSKLSILEIITIKCHKRRSIVRRIKCCNRQINKEIIEIISHSVKKLKILYSFLYLIGANISNALRYACILV